MGIVTVLLLMAIVVYLLEGDDRIAQSTKEVWPDLLESGDQEREVPNTPANKDSLGEQEGT
jgi:hypothetical protein